MSSMASPPPLFIGGAGVTVEINSTGRSPSSPYSSSSIENVKPSVIIIILILSITVLVSVSLCLLLRHLNRRCLRHLSRTSMSAISAGAVSHRVSPEQSQTASLLDSLPVFTFSSITRRSNNNESTVSGDCAVCLSKFEPHDQLRLLPLCCHAFHARCIDTWLVSNQTCPLCRSPLFASESDVMKVLLQSSNTGSGIGTGGSDSFRLEIGSISRRQPGSNSSERRSYSVGSFEYTVDEVSKVTRNQTHQRTVSDKEEIGGVEAASEASLAAEVATGRSWLKEYVDRLSFSVSSRAQSFRSSGRFFTGSSRRSDISGAVGDYDVEANRIGEEISEMFRWFSGV